MDVQKIINNNIYLKSVLTKNINLFNKLKNILNLIKNSPKVKNPNSIGKKLKETNSEENLISVIGELNVCAYFLKINIDEIDLGGRLLPNGKRVDFIIKWNSLTIFVEIKTPQVELNRLFGTTDLITIYDEERLTNATLEVIKTRQLSENDPNLLVFYLGHSTANKDDFEAAFEYLVTDALSHKPLRCEGLFYRKKDNKFVCHLISGILAVRDYDYFISMKNPNVDPALNIEKFFDFLKSRSM